MSKKKDLAKNTIVLTVGKICTQFINFFLLPLYTSALTTEEYGTVDLLTTYVSLLLPIVLLQMDQAFFRFLLDVKNDEEGKSKIISTTIIFSLFQIIFFSIIYSVIQIWITNEYKFFIWSNLIASILSSLSLQAARGFSKNTTYAIGSFISAFTQILFNIVFILGFHLGAKGMLLATCLGQLCCTIYIVYKEKVLSFFRFSNFKNDSLKEMLCYSVPLVPNALSWWAVSASDRLIVSFFLGAGANGILSISHKFSTIYITFYNIFNLSWTESASLHMNDEDRDEFFSSVINSMSCLFLSLGLCLIAIMPFLFPIMINSKFNDAYNQIPIYIIATMFNVVVGLLSVVYVALKKTKEIAKTSIFAGIINIIFNLSTIHFIGLYAASISSVVAYAAMTIYRYFDLKKYIDLNFDMKSIIEIAILLLVVMWGYYFASTIIQFILSWLTILFCLILNKSFIKESLVFVKNMIKK